MWGDATHSKDEDVCWSKCIAERVAILTGLHVEQQVGHSVHCDVGNHCECISSNTQGETVESGQADYPARLAGYKNLPVCSELYFSMLTGDQLWNEREVGDLCGRPAKLKDDDERDEVGQADPLRGKGVAAQTLVEDEGKGQHHTHCAWKTHTDKDILSVVVYYDDKYIILFIYTQMN